MNVILETERLIVRELVEDDAEAVLAFNGDPEVMRMTHEPLWTDLGETRRRLREYPDYRAHGYGRWGLWLKDEERIVGFNGLKYLPQLGETDLGYRLCRDCWGRGLATESSLAIVRHGFDVLGLQRILGLVLPTNLASIRVLLKVGMRRDGNVEIDGMHAQRWVIER
jgi:RimJ/RimL family protein N-acetyltransferase